MNQETKAHLLNADTWLRLLYMILFALLSLLARMVILAVALLQFLLVLFTGKTNLQLLALGQGTAKWAYQAFLFLTFNSDDKPYPFADWPEVAVATAEEAELEAVDESAPPASSDDVPSFVAPQPHPADEQDEQDRDKA